MESIFDKQLLECTYRARTIKVSFVLFLWELHILPVFYDSMSTIGQIARLLIQLRKQETVSDIYNGSLVFLFSFLLAGWQDKSKCDQLPWAGLPLYSYLHCRKFVVVVPVVIFKISLRQGHSILYMFKWELMTRKSSLLSMSVKFRSQTLVIIFWLGQASQLHFF